VCSGGVRAEPERHLAPEPARLFNHHGGPRAPPPRRPPDRPVGRLALRRGRSRLGPSPPQAALPGRDVQHFVLPRLDRLALDPAHLHRDQRRPDFRLRRRPAARRVRRGRRQPCGLVRLLPDPGPGHPRRDARAVSLFCQDPAAMGALPGLGTVGPGHADGEQELGPGPGRTRPRVRRHRATGMADLYVLGPHQP